MPFEEPEHFIIGPAKGRWKAAALYINIHPAHATAINSFLSITNKSCPAFPEFMTVLCVTIRMKGYCAVLSWGTVVILYKVVLTFKSVNGTLVCDRSNESYSVSITFI